MIGLDHTQDNDCLDESAKHHATYCAPTPLRRCASSACPSPWAAAPPSVAGLTFVGWNETVGCGGVAVIPGDIIVADSDGAVVIPQALLDEVVAESPAQEKLEGWIIEEVERGEKLPGLYPMNEETKVRYETWLANNQS